MKPILYLDVDDTLLRFPPWSAKRYRQQKLNGRMFEGIPAPGVKEFLIWARENCEVRWLTMWAMRGAMHPELEEKLARLLNIPQSLISDWHNPIDWGDTPGALKTAGIDWAEHDAGRPWIWIEDEGLLREDYLALKERKVFDRFYECNTSRKADALMKVWRRLLTRKATKDWWHS